MSRKWMLRGVLIVLVVLFASLGTARAHQVLTEQQAHNSMVGARAAAGAALHQAGATGLTASDLAPLRLDWKRLNRAAPPSASPLWDTRRAEFYNQQRAAYQALTGRTAR